MGWYDYTYIITPLEIPSSFYSSLGMIPSLPFLFYPKLDLKLHLHSSSFLSLSNVRIGLGVGE